MVAAATSNQKTSCQPDPVIVIQFSRIVKKDASQVSLVRVPPIGPDLHHQLQSTAIASKDDYFKKEVV